MIEGNIGRGGMGQVFRAWDQQLGRHVALKRINNDASVDEAIRREAGILAAMHHPNIVSIFDFAADETGPFVVMELVQGRDLDLIATIQPVDVSTFLELVNQVCRGVSSAHAAGLLHLDLKPGNIMVQRHADGSFTAKILDFGLARAREDHVDPNVEEIYASPYTVSPEQLNRQPVDVRSDIYSLGCVFYYALSGKNPFEAPLVADVLRRHLDGVTTPLHLIAPKVPKAMSQVIARMIAVDPNQRPQSVEQARSELQKASRAPAPASGLLLATPHQAPSARSRPGNTSTPVANKTSGKSGLFIVLLLVGAGIAAWWMLGPGKTNLPGAAAPGSSHDVVAAPSQAPTLLLDPADISAFASHKGELVTVEGTVGETGESRLFRAVLLKFKGVPADGIVVSVPQDLMAADQRQGLIGKKLRVSGKYSSAAGENRLVVESAGDIKEMAR